MVTGSISNWVTDLGKDNAEVPGSIPGAPLRGPGIWHVLPQLNSHGCWRSNV